MNRKTVKLNEKMVTFMNDKSTITNHLIWLINHAPGVQVQTMIGDEELRLWKLTDEYGLIKENLNCMFDLIIKCGDIRCGERRIILATKQGSESQVSILLYKVDGDVIKEPTLITLYDHNLAKFVHNKRVELNDLCTHNTVQNVIDFIDGKRNFI